jgi:hypothetical protein
MLDGIGLSAAGAFAGADPSKTSQLYRTGTGTNEVQSLAAIASASGTWTLTLKLPGQDDIVTAAIAFNASAAVIEAAIDTALAGLTINGVAFVASDISCAGGAINANPVTLTFDGACVQKCNITASTTQDVDLNDATPPVVSTTTPGVAAGRLTLSGAGTATYPNVWDGLTASRGHIDDDRGPDAKDWAELLKQIRLIQTRVQPLVISATGTIPTANPAKTGALWANATILAVSAVGTAQTLSLWDGTSPSRSTVDVFRQPDWQDYEEAYKQLTDMMDQLVPLGFGALGTLPTSDPAVAGQLWTNSGAVTVSAG